MPAQVVGFQLPMSETPGLALAVADLSGINRWMRILVLSLSVPLKKIKDLFTSYVRRDLCEIRYRVTCGRKDFFFPIMRLS